MIVKTGRYTFSASFLIGTFLKQQFKIISAFEIQESTPSLNLTKDFSTSQLLPRSEIAFLLYLYLVCIKSYVIVHLFQNRQIWNIIFFSSDNSIVMVRKRGVTIFILLFILGVLTLYFFILEPEDRLSTRKIKVSQVYHIFSLDYCIRCCLVNKNDQHFQKNMWRD